MSEFYFLPHIYTFVTHITIFSDNSMEYSIQEIWNMH